jgi:hypothetical protein
MNENLDEIDELIAEDKKNLSYFRKEASENLIKKVLLHLFKTYGPPLMLPKYIEKHILQMRKNDIIWMHEHKIITPKGNVGSYLLHYLLDKRECDAERATEERWDIFRWAYKQGYRSRSDRALVLNYWNLEFLAWWRSQGEKWPQHSVLLAYRADDIDMVHQIISEGYQCVSAELEEVLKDKQEELLDTMLASCDPYVLNMFAHQVYNYYGREMSRKLASKGILISTDDMAMIINNRRWTVVTNVWDLCSEDYRTIVRARLDSKIMLELEEKIVVSESKDGHLEN